MKIYKLIKNDKVIYVGSTEQKLLSNRVSKHRIGGGPTSGTSKKDFDSYELIEETEDEHRESYWIKFYDTFNNGENKTEDGRSYSEPKKRIRVYNDKLDKTFNSITIASEELNINRSGLCSVLSGRYKTTGGYKVEYVKDDE